MFERMTDRARRVVDLSREEAVSLNHNYIGTEHLMLGLIREGEGVAYLALEELGVSNAAVHDLVLEIIGKGAQEPTGPMPFTPRAKKVLEYALREALQLGHSYIGTEHLLLGIIREGEGVAAQALYQLGIDLNTVRQKVIQLLNGYQGAASATPTLVGDGSIWVAEIKHPSMAGRATANARTRSRVNMELRSKLQGHEIEEVSITMIVRNPKGRRRVVTLKPIVFGKAKD